MVCIETYLCTLPHKAHEFHIISCIAGIPIDIYALRQQTVAYLGSFPQFFGSYFDNRWASFSNCMHRSLFSSAAWHIGYSKAFP